MVAVLWVSLPRSWKITEVQAGLQVCIALLCTWGIFAFSRFCWQLSSNLVRKKRAVALASLMSINTIGEAFDVISLLKRRIFLQRYWKLLAQSVVVICLTVATIVSGPIAKASTRVGSVTKVISIPGNLATNKFNSRTYANVDWNETYSSLDQAGFPLDQLLDYMPQANSTWMYRASEWNNSWTMECNKTENTAITLYDTGVCGNMSVELPATNDFFAYDDFDSWYIDWHALFNNGTQLQDGMVIFTGWTYPGYDTTKNITYNMTVTVAAMHIHGMLKANDSSKCDFGRGPVDSASYTMMECFMKRPQTVPDEDHIAFPDATDYFALSQAYTGAYFDRMSSEANQNKTISVIPPDELIRFYQTYIITKDQQYPQPVTRQLTANIPVVQLSSTFIAFGSLYALVVILGMINFAIFSWRNRQHIRETPESKLDWILQSILDEREASLTTARQSSARRSYVARAELAANDSSEKIRHMFERARYGASHGEDVPLAYQGATVPAATPGSIYNQSPIPANEFFRSPPMQSGWAGNTPHQYDMNPYEVSYTNHHGETGPSYELPNPENLFTSDRRKGYQRLG